MAKRKLLLADDSITIQKVVNLTFADEGIEVISVGDGNSAMDKIREESPDIVLADVNMPGLNGYEVCEKIKTSEHSSNTPVILLVGSFEPFDTVEADRVGADEHLTKPFQSISQLVNTVAVLINSQDAESDSEKNEELSAAATPGGGAAPSVNPTSSFSDFSEPSLDDEMIQTDQIGSVPVDDMSKFGALDTDEPGGGDTESENPGQFEMKTETAFSPEREGDTGEFAIVEDSEEPIGERDQDTDSTFEPEDSSNDFAFISNDESTEEPSTEAVETISGGETELELDELNLLELSFDDKDGEIDLGIDVSDDDEVESVETPDEGDYETGFAFQNAESEEIEKPEPPVSDPVETGADAEEERSIEGVSPELIDEISKRVVERLSENAIRDIAGEFVPLIAERVVREVAEEKLKD